MSHVWIFMCVCLQKDSHTLYLEQELESLKVVLDMKNNQLHQKEKKLMEMEKLVKTSVFFFFFSLMLIIKIVFLILFFSLHADIFLNIWMCVFVSVLQVETNVKLEECLKKVQQENEDFKARMDKHAALSK